MTTKKATTTKRGKPLNCWMHDDDIQRIRDLATFISSEGFRVSDSQVLKAALRIAKPDSRFLRAFEEVRDSDGRLKKDE